MFVKATFKEYEALKRILDGHCMASGQRVNFSKLEPFFLRSVITCKLLF